MHFWKSCQKLQQKNFDSSAKSLKLSNKIGSFTLKQTAPVTVLWSRRMPLSRPCQNVSIACRKLLVSASEDSFAVKYIFKKSSSKCSSGCVGGSFYQHAALLFGIHFLWLKNQRQSCCLLEKTFFLGIFLCAGWMQTCHKNGEKSKNIPLKLWGKM